MENKGFEVVSRDSKRNIVIDRKVNNISDGHWWAKIYAEKHDLISTFYIDGKPVVTYHSDENRQAI